MNIVLIGYRGAGKSAVGRRLAGLLRRRFVDIDDLLEGRCGAPIIDIVKSRGWGYFRAIEKRVIEEMSRKDYLVIAPGGGVVLDPENVMVLKRKGFLIWLKANAETLCERMKQDRRTFSQRPPLTGKGILGEIEEVMSCREPLYEKAADIQLDTSSMDVEAVVGAVLSVLKERRQPE